MPDVASLCKVAAAAAWQAAFDENRLFEATIVLADDVLVRSLNREYRNQDKSTNVLSFSYSENQFIIPDDVPTLGDIIIAFETTKSEAPNNLSNHLSHLVVHGCLHLLGFDHEDEKEAEKMEGMEIDILAGLKIADPYSQVSEV